VLGPGPVPDAPEQIAFSSSLICTGARRNPATFGTHHGILKRLFDPWWDVSRSLGVVTGKCHYVAFDFPRWREVVVFANH